MVTTVYDDMTANELADDAAEAIRGLNHLTRDAGSLHYPSEEWVTWSCAASIKDGAQGARSDLRRVIASSEADPA